MLTSDNKPVGEGSDTMKTKLIVGLAALATGDPRAGTGITRDDLLALLS